VLLLLANVKQCVLASITLRDSQSSDCQFLLEVLLQVVLKLAPEMLHHYHFALSSRDELAMLLVM
jgi:hypothetical protein